MRAEARHVERARRRTGNGGKIGAAAAVGFVVGLAAYQAKKMAVQATTSIKGDWVETLKAEHRIVEKAFEGLLATTHDEKVKRATLLTTIAHLLGKHGLEEENIIYPALRGGHHEDEARRLFLDHADIKTFIHELEDMPKDDLAWIGKARDFFDLIQRHVAEEEELLPRFRDSLTPEQNRKLSAQVYREGVKLA